MKKVLIIFAILSKIFLIVKGEILNEQINNKITPYTQIEQYLLLNNTNTMKESIEPILKEFKHNEIHLNENDNIFTRTINKLRYLTTSTSGDPSIIYNDYNSFVKACGETQPVTTKNCTNIKYTDYFCCHITYKSSNNPSYCSGFYDLVARAKTLESSSEFSYTCASQKLFYSLISLLIILYLIII